MVLLRVRSSSLAREDERTSCPYSTSSQKQEGVSRSKPIFGLCRRCKGSGTVSTYGLCSYCQGLGMVPPARWPPQHYGPRMQYLRCHGLGSAEYTVPCPRCKGTG